MDKTKLRIKRKRQQARRREREAELKDITERLKERFKEEGIKPKHIKPTEVMREYNRIQRNSTATAIWYNTICTLYCMHKLYGFGKRRLFRMAIEITVRVNNIATVQRSIPQMTEDLKLDAKLDARSYWKDIEYSDRLTPERKAELECIAMGIPHLLTIQMYAVHLALNFKKTRMNRLCEMVPDAVRFALANDSLNNYIEELNKCGFYIDLNGKFGARGIKEEDYTKFKKRITWSGGDLLNAKR